MGRKYINELGSAADRVAYLDGLLETPMQPRCRICPKDFPSLDERSATEHVLGVILQ